MERWREGGKSDVTSVVTQLGPWETATSTEDHRLKHSETPRIAKSQWITSPYITNSTPHTFLLPGPNLFPSLGFMPADPPSSLSRTASGLN